MPCPWDSPGKNPGVGCHFLLQGLFHTQGSNPHLLQWLEDFIPLSETGVLGDFWGRIKDAKYRFAFQDGTWDIF